MMLSGLFSTTKHNPKLFVWYQYSNSLYFRVISKYHILEVYGHYTALQVLLPGCSGKRCPHPAGFIARMLQESLPASCGIHRPHAVGISARILRDSLPVCCRNLCPHPAGFIARIRGNTHLKYPFFYANLIDYQILILSSFFLLR